MNIKLFLFSIILIVTCSSLGAHVNRGIRLLEGKLEGLPKRYEPAGFSIKDRKIEIGELYVVFPDCVWMYFEKAKEADFRFSASWYHDPKNLPPYIVIDVEEDGIKNRFHLVLNLDTLAIINFYETVQASKTLWIQKKIPLGENCISNWRVLKKAESTQKSLTSR